MFLYASGSARGADSGQARVSEGRQHRFFKAGWYSALGAAVILNRINVLPKPVWSKPKPC